MNRTNKWEREKERKKTDKAKQIVATIQTAAVEPRTHKNKRKQNIYKS